jgi:hypothetical protein
MCTFSEAPSKVFTVNLLLVLNILFKVHLYKYSLCYSHTTKPVLHDISY